MATVESKQTITLDEEDLKKIIAAALEFTYGKGSQFVVTLNHVPSYNGPSEYVSEYFTATAVRFLS